MDRCRALHGWVLDVQQLETWFGHLLTALAMVAAALLLGMVLIISADVLLRNVPLVPGMMGLDWANQVSESMLMLITMLAAPWLLRRGQHIRVDIVLRAIPKTAAWYTEWLADVLGLACCVLMMVNSWSALMASYRSGSLAIKTLVTPEWWSLAPMPVAFALLAIEMLFRMCRLWHADKGPRDDAVSAS